MSLSVGYLIRYLPAPSQTFVLDEARALSSQGVRAIPWVLDRVPRAVRHARHEELYKATNLTPRPSSPRCLYAALVSEELAPYAELRRHWQRHGRGRDLRRVAWLARSMRAQGIDVLRVHFAGEVARFAVAAGRLANIPVSIAVHGRDLFVPEADFDWIVHHAAHVSTITEMHRERLLRLGLPSQQVTVLRCPVTLPPGPARLPANDGTLRLLTVGRLVPKKGHDLLLSACERMVEQGQPVALTIVGGGREALSLRNQVAAARRRLGERVGQMLRVDLLGATPVETVEGLLREGGYHAAVLACRVADDGDRDGIPVFLLEALAHGVPVVTSDLPGFEEEFGREQGARLLPLVDRGSVLEPDPEDLADVLLELARRPRRRASLAHAARVGAQARASERGSPEVVGAELARVLDRLCAKFRAPSEAPREVPA